MKTALLFGTLLILGIVGIWAIEGNGSISAWKSKTADVVFFALTLPVVIERGASIFRWLFIN